MRCSMVSLVVACFLAVAAHADRPLLPAPIASGELESYGRPLALSEPQMQAWRRSLVEYHAEFRETRTAMLESLAPLRAHVGEVPDLVSGAVADQFFSGQRRAMDVLLALDRRLLESIEPALAEEQREMLPAVVEARHRRVLLDDEFINRWFWRSRFPEWRDLMEDAGIDPAAHDGIEAMVREADFAFTRELAEFHRRLGRVHVEWARAMDRAEFDPNEPDGVSYSTRFGVYVEVAEPARQTYARLFEMRRRTLMRLVDALPPDESWTFFKSAMSRGTSGVIATHVMRADQVIERARRLLDPDEAHLAAFEHDVRRAVIEYARSAIAAHDELRTSNPPPLAGAFDGRENFDVDEPRERMNARIGERIATLGGEAAAELAGVWRPDADRAPATPEERSRRIIDQFAGDLAPDPFVPGPLTRDVLRLFAEAAGLDDDRRAIANHLHEEYERSFLRIRRQEVIEVITVFVGWRFPDHGEDRVGRFSEPTEVEKKHEARRRARHRIAAIDQAFFDDLEAAVLDEENLDALALLRLARAGQAYTRGIRINMYVAGDFLPYRASLVEAVDGAELSPQARAAAMEALAPHVEPLISLLRKMSESELLINRHHDVATAYMIHMPDEIPTFEESPAAAVDELRRVRRAVVSESEAALLSIAAALPEEEAERVRDSYLRLAYPSVYEDEAAKHEEFRAALARPDLPTPVRETLAEHWMDYQIRYRDLSRRMTEVLASATHAGIAIDDEARAQIEQINRRVEAIRLERDEVNEQATIALAAAAG